VPKKMDAESSLYVMVFFLVLLLDEKTLRSSANSLALDETLVSAISLITADLSYLRYSPSPYLHLATKPLNPTRALREHIALNEIVYTKLIGQMNSKKGI
jgi:hypothetical protein